MRSGLLVRPASDLGPSHRNTWSVKQGNITGDLGTCGRLTTQSRSRGRPGLVRWTRSSQPDFGNLHTATVGSGASCFHAPAVIAILSGVGEKELLRPEA